MIHIIDGVEYTENPLIDVSVAHALAEGDEVVVVDDWGEVVYQGSSSAYGYQLLEIVTRNTFKYQLENPKSNVVFLADYRRKAKS